MIREIPGPAGRLEALLDEPDALPRAAVVFAHPHPQHGGTMHTKVVYRGAKAKFFIHGERDALCPLSAVRQLYGRACEPKELVVIDAADHLFDGKVGEVSDALEELLADHPGGEVVTDGCGRA